jgi:hypothetical protein
MVIKTTENEYRYLSEDCGGWCLKCGEEAFGVEPDARRYECECCGARAVYGADEALLMGMVEFTEEEGDES